MKVTIRNDKVQIEGYVNAVERFSKPLVDNRGNFIERILAGVFKRAIKKNKNVLVLLNHWEDHKVAETGNGTAQLVEDNVGLRAFVETDDARVVEKARAQKLCGWSFGFSNPTQEFETGKDGIEQRTISDLRLIEVSILDDEKVPAYYGTSIETRGDDENNVEVTEYRALVETQPFYVTIRNEEGGDPSNSGGEDSEGKKDGGEEDPHEPEAPDLSEHKAKINKLIIEGVPTNE